MSISSIDKIYNEAEILWDLIKDHKDIPPLDAFFVSAGVISRRITIETLFKESILPQISVKGVTAVSECRKLGSFNKIDCALYSQLYFYLHAKVPKGLSETCLESVVEFFNLRDSLFSD